MEQLIRAQTKDLDDFAVEPVEAPLREMRNQVVEGRPPTLNADRNLRRQSPVAIVAQRSARGGDGIGRSGVPRNSQRGIEAARRRDHDSRAAASPAASREPARNSLVLIGRRLLLAAR